jgi:hypothetical protein
MTSINNLDLRRAGKHLLIIQFFLMLICSHLSSQDKFIQNYKVSTWFGFRYMERDSFQNNENIDFLNYLLSYDEAGVSEYQYLGFTAHFWLRNNWEAVFKIAMFDDFAPNNLNITIHHYPLGFAGFSLGIYGFPQLLNDFSTYHRVNDAGWYGDINTNFRQRYLYEYGLSTGARFKVNWKSLHLFTGMNFGITRVPGFREIVQQKEINTNFRKEIHYKTHASWSPFLFPELELNIELFKLKQKTAGIQLQTNWYSTNRRMNYTRTVYSWEMNTPEIDEIKPRLHRIKKFEADLGVYLRW